MTEAEAGSDVGNLKTRAEMKNGKFVITGSKVWITNGGISNWFFVLAKTNFDADANSSNAFTGFIVDANQKGVVLGKKVICFNKTKYSKNI